jgi:5-methylcytosine-specific restriction endonuclease McrA
VGGFSAFWWQFHVVDHIIPLKRGGADSPSNMQWQTIEEAKQKDKWE